MTTLVPKYDQGATGAVNRPINEKLAETVSVKDFGALGNGVADDAAAIQLAFSSGKSVYFPDGSYLMSSQVTATNDNICVDFGNATIINNNTGGWIFAFGTSGDTFQSTGLRITGGNFTQANPATTTGSNFIYIKAIKDFSVKNTILNNVGNGGICVEAGAESGVIDNVTINGRTAYSVCRGIWLQGATASDFSTQYVDTNSITRNATPFPVYAVKDVKIVNCTVIVPNYGIYLMNAWNCVIDNCYVDTSGVGSTRCIAVNNYSPGTRVTNCTLISDRSCTGILITQCSDNVIVANNIFKGSFGGNRAVYVQYLAKAFITNNQFTDLTTQNIEVNMGGFAHIKNNEFVRITKTNDHRAVYFNAIDPASVGTAIGSTGTVLVGSGVIFEGNLLDHVCLGVYSNTAFAASNGNEPAPEFLQVTDNTFINYDLATTSSERPLTLGAGASGNNINLRFERNVLYPYTTAYKNSPNINGTDYILECTTNTMALFRVEVITAGGAITVAKQAGNNFSCTASRSGANLVLTPRSQLGTSGASVPSLVSITNENGLITPHTYTVVRSANNYVISAYNSAGAAISFATAGITFNVLFGPLATGT